MNAAVLSFAAWCADRGWPLYAVGGGVRNELLGLPAQDWDLTGPIPPDVLLSALPTQVKTILTGLAYGTVTIGWQGYWMEYTAFRQDFYRQDHTQRGAHRPERVAFTVDMRQDALRRDFTINAIYRTLPNGELYDPVGGQADLAQRLLRIPHAGTFEDDGLRLLRMVRLAAQLGCDIHPDTWQHACERAEYLAHLSRERIGQEIDRILLCDQPYPQHARGPVWALERLQQAGFMPYCLQREQVWLPGAALPPNKALRLAALMQTDGSAVARALCWNKKDRQAVDIWQAAWAQREAQSAAVRREVLLGVPSISGWLAWLSAAECANLLDWQADADWLHLQNPPKYPSEMALSGRMIADILGGASPAVGHMQAGLWRWVLAGGQNEAEALRQRLHEMIEGANA